MANRRWTATLAAFVFIGGGVGLARSAEAATTVPDTCDVGGSGYSSCSMQSSDVRCNVTCDPGYYACCNYDGPECTCKR
jgi:hypothetical protein